jgi:hypothetical protein
VDHQRASGAAALQPPAEKLLAGKTALSIAQQHRVSESTVHRDAQYGRDVDTIAAHAGEDRPSGTTLDQRDSLLFEFNYFGFSRSDHLVAQIGQQRFF